MYHGAATAAAQPLEYQQRVQAGSTLPSDWAVMGLKVQFLKSPYDAGKYDNMDGKFRFRTPIYLRLLFNSLSLNC